ncbi:cytochrome b/b6 domain-containing protein [Massilia litorea]|jgi:thiosulfate reductase cytochrome b subunit|uniref:Cytochrome b/b6 domain-containing protein n=1 Tax=Massilia litorea TaxID=2769491 RepID=A0A7L9U3A7_9BURK|nr:cytochrome b/b6 domain-containing protein [Massilia litorea]QOL48506.1 cytochrome b/b6 domain-containing protein [Massilia litorea]
MHRFHPQTIPGAAAATAGERRLFYRHRLPIRIMHWINVVSFFLMLMSGLGIFNAHPRLYWGKASDFDAPLLSITARPGPDGEPQGVTRIGKRVFNTDGVLGASHVAGEAQPSERAFPSWATIPGPQYLATARNWHLFFAWIFVLNGIAYVGYTVFSGHLRRDLVPSKTELRGIGGSLKDHLLFRHPAGEAAKRYNVLQNLTYLGVIFVLLPLIVLAGLGMSPRLDALFGGWVDLLGGRQSARTLHFLAACLLLAFVVVHVFEVIVTGLWNNLRSMITGYYRLPEEEHAGERKGRAP